MSLRDVMCESLLQSYRGKQRFFNSLSVEEGGGGTVDGQATPSDGSLKVPRSNKQPNRWSGLWGAAPKVGVAPNQS